MELELTTPLLAPAYARETACLLTLESPFGFNLFFNYH